MSDASTARRPTDGLVTSLTWALRFVWESGRTLTLANGALTIVQGLVPLLSLYVMKMIVDAVAAGIAAPDRGAGLSAVIRLVILAGAIVLLERGLATLADLVKALHAQLATDRVYRTLHAKSVEVDLQYYEQPEYFDALHRAQQEAPYRPSRILESVFRLGQSVVSLGAIGWLLLTFHWSVPLLVVLAGMPGLVIRFLYARRLYAASRRQTPSERLALYFHGMLTSDGHAKEIRLFGLGEVFASRFEVLRDRIRGERTHILTRRAVADLLAHAGAVVPVFVLFGVIVARAVQGLLSLGDLVMFYQALQRGQTSLNQFAAGVADLYENQLFLRNVQEFLGLRPSVRDPEHPRPVPRLLRDGIVLREVRFRYPHGESLILDGINLHIRPGEHVALVGENGCGKTTLVKLLARLYDPTSGDITIDGCDLRDLPVAELRRAIGVVFQDYGKYNLPARDNIWLGDIEQRADGNAVETAARIAGIHDVLARLPKGYDTVLGRKFDAGEELSIGQWQKIALARAFFRDSPIVILDEPTSALDARSEAELFERFVGLFRDRTAVLISHRLSTVKMVDRICFMEQGRIVESGSHDDLIDRRGRYAEMFEVQARHYR